MPKFQITPHDLRNLAIIDVVDGAENLINRVVVKAKDGSIRDYDGYSRKAAFVEVFKREPNKTEIAQHIRMSRCSEITCE